MAKYGQRIGGPASVVAEDWERQQSTIEQMGLVILQLFAERDAALASLAILTAMKETA
jgi:hypothetical protein